MVTIQSLIRTDIVAACRDSAVATAAGIDLLAWQDETAPHVFDCIQGYLGGRCRGRLPFIEVNVDDMNFDTHNTEGGTVETSATIRCHVGSKDQATAADLSASILLTSLQKIRDSSTVTYFSDGSESLDPLTAGPWGLMRDLRVFVRHTFNNSTYGVQ